MVQPKVRQRECRAKGAPSRWRREMHLGKRHDWIHRRWPRLVEHAADTSNRYSTGRDGMAPYKRVNGRESKSPVVSFAEGVYYNFARRVVLTYDKVDFARSEGVFLAVVRVSHEYFDGTGRDGRRVYCCKGASEEQCWDVGFFGEVK